MFPYNCAYCFREIIVSLIPNLGPSYVFVIMFLFILFCINLLFSSIYHDLIGGFGGRGGGIGSGGLLGSGSSSFIGGISPGGSNRMVFGGGLGGGIGGSKMGGGMLGGGIGGAGLAGGMIGGKDC